MKIAFFLGHPAHFHVLKNVAKNLVAKGHSIVFLIKQKDILESLLQYAGFEYTVIRAKERSATSRLGLMISLLKMDINMFRYLRKNNPNILIGTYIDLLTKFTKTSFIAVNEDDASVVPFYAKLSYPWADAILNPQVCDSGKWNSKATKYESYQELAYLHPNHFSPNKKVVEKYFSLDKPYFIIRFAKLTAHHDTGIQGLNTTIAEKIIDILKPHGRIYITSERSLEPQFEQYRVQINPLDMHDVMAFAQIYIGDSQTMAAEAGVLGVPFVRFNDFVGRIGYLRELEDDYGLGYGVKTNEVERLYQIIADLIEMPNRKELFQERRQKMLSEKIDYAKFLTWFIENYPESKNIMKKDSDYQYNFK